MVAMLEITNKDHCSGCFACYNICPKQCISMDSDTEGFVYPSIDASKCVNCRLCETVCPVIAPPQISSRERTSFAAVNLDESIRLQSSSGGVFTALAEHIISQNGVVFGAALSDNCRNVRHIAVENTVDLELLRGSKYVQSAIGDTYQLAKNALEAGRSVLFSGTPCQIAGLHSYLRNSYDNLYTCDVICHGVPSPLVWQKYVEFREEKAASKVQKVCFRHKKYSWKSFCMQFTFADGTQYLQPLGKDPYLHGFLSNLYLRPSCYNCNFKGLSRPADITLADFWGIENIAPQLNDNKGTSLVIIHSEKGNDLFAQLRGSMSVQSVDLSKSVKYNSAAEKSVAIPKKRVSFFRHLDTLPFSKLLAKYCSVSPKERLRKAAGRILRKIKRIRSI